MIFLVTGDSGTGKTTFLKDLATILRNKNFYPGGFTAPGSWHNGVRSGFVLHDLNHKKEYPLAETGKSGIVMQGPFVFNIETVELGNNLLLRQMNDPQIDLIFVDEVGPFELRGEGWAPSLEILVRVEKPQIWAVRPQLAEQVAERWNFVPALSFSVHEENPEQVFSKIAGLCFTLKR
jgi:nucleoside-triphosphatase